MSDGVRITCNQCGRRTFHHVAYEQVIDDPVYRDERIIYVLSQRVRVLTCKGCNTPSYEEAWKVDEVGEEPGLFGPDVDIYPDRTFAWLEPRQYAQLPSNLEGIYAETIHAFNRDMLQLCTVGLRCLIEGICEDQGVVPSMPDGKYASIYSKIEGLKQKLPTALVDNLHAFRFMGNMAAHQLSVPPKSDLQLAMAVIEDLMNFLYHLDYQASLLAGKHDPGKKKEAPGGK